MLHSARKSTPEMPLTIRQEPAPVRRAPAQARQHACDLDLDLDLDLDNIRPGQLCHR
jgi:hypothetical protein